MSGHNKWSTIKHKKAREDAKRGKVFTRIIREITVAARTGGGDPDGNPRLRAAIQAAKAANMPSDNMERAIKRGTGELEGITYEEVVYEGYAPGGVAILIEAVTDNKSRTVADVRFLLNKHGGSLAEPNSVAWQFDQVGQLMVEGEGTDEETVMMLAIDAGADDIASDDDCIIVTTSIDRLFSVQGNLEEHGLSIREAGLSYSPKTPLDVPADKTAAVVRLLEALDDCDDVQKIHTNAEFPDDMVAS